MTMIKKGTATALAQGINHEARFKLVQARTELLFSQCFFGTLAMHLRLVEDPTCFIAYTDGEILGYNPFAILALTPEECQWVVMHEVLHSALGHPWRRGARQWQRWCYATDVVVNWTCAEVSMKQPANTVPTAAEFKGKSAEYVYAHLPPSPEIQVTLSLFSKSDDGNGNGNGNGNGSGQGKDDSSDQKDQSDGDGSGKQSKQQQKQKKAGGGAGSGKPMQGQHCACDGVRDAGTGKDSSGPNAPSEADWQVKVTQAANAARAAGQLPASLEYLVGKLEAPRIDWRAALRRFVQDYATADYCVSPDTLVLRANLTWDRAENIKTGDELVAVDETASAGKHRKVCTAVVEAANTFIAPRVRVTTDRGTIDVTPEHQFLVSRAKGKSVYSHTAWVRADRLRRGNQIRALVVPWSEDRSDSWLSGMLDGEGSLTANTPNKPRAGVNLKITQNAGAVLRVLVRNATTSPANNRHGSDDCYAVRVSAIPDILRIVGQHRPTRLLPKLMTMIRDRYFTIPRGHATVRSVQTLDSGDVVALRTSTRTLIANGLISHNSWRRPNRKYVASRVYLPALHNEQMPPIAIGVDTSGSISDAELTAFFSEIQSIVDEVKPTRTFVIQCDASVKTPHDTFEHGERFADRDIKVHGRGGTAFNPVFQYIEAQDLQPVCLIYLTDLECYDDPQPPDGYEVMWVSTNESLSGRFGGTIYLNDGGVRQ